MNKILYTISVLYLAILFTGCDQKIDYPYQGKDRIQFKHYTVNYNGGRVYKDSIDFSFGMLTTDIQIDTVKIPVEFLGKLSDRDRTYKVKIDADSTTAQEGVHYETIAEDQVFLAGKQVDTLRLVAYRGALSSSFANPKKERIDLVLLPSEDFDLGLKRGLRMTVRLNNYLAEPAWWNNNTGLDYYHPQKWRILMTFHDDYKDPVNCGFHINNEGRGYREGLRRYLEDFPTYDEETGARVFMFELVEKEE